MNRLADLCDANADELARIETLQTGTAYKLRRESDFAFASDNLRFFAGEIRHLEGKAAYEYSGSHTSMIRREPIGVVAQVAPWNYPFWMAIWKIGPALAAGNSVVLKPASATPITTIRLAELAAEAGVPAGVLNVVTGRGRRGRRGDGRPHGCRPHLADRRFGDRPADPGPGGRQRQAGPSRARRQGPVHRPRRRGPRGRGPRRDRRGADQRRPGLHGGHPGLRPPLGLRGVPAPDGRAVRRRPGRRPVRSGDRSGHAHQPGPGRAGRRLRPSGRGGRGSRGRRRRTSRRARLPRRGVLPPDDRGRLRPGQRDRPEGDLRAGPGRPAVRHRRRGPGHGQRHEVRPGRLDLDPRRVPGDGGGAPAGLRPRPGQRPPDGDLRDAPRRLQAVGLRQGHVELLVRGVHPGQARHDRADRRAREALALHDLRRQARRSHKRMPPPFRVSSEPASRSWPAR